jgi:hypothetical protein
MKTCTKCKESKEDDQFYTVRSRKGALTARCKECINSLPRYPVNRAASAEAMRKYRAQHPERVRYNQVKCNYGLSAEEYDALILNQHNLCAICGQPESKQTRGKTRPLSVDHHHTTKKVRALLCDRCNKGLGHFKDSPELLELASKYLKTHS